MTYPDPRYLGETGEVSASYRPADHAPDLTYRNGNTVHYLATGAATGGGFGLYRAAFAVTGRPSANELADFYLHHDNHWR